jgi:hypothetical protein
MMLGKIYLLDIDKCISYMKKRGIEIDENSAFKRVAKEHYMHPATLYAMLLASQI